MNGRGITLVLGTAAGAFLAAGFISLATSPVSHADDGDGITISNPPGPTQTLCWDPCKTSACSRTRVSPTRMNILERWLSTFRLWASPMF